MEAALASVPATVVVEPANVAVVSAGLVWSLFAPPGARWMPSAPLSWIELEEKRLPLPLSISMPKSPLCAITLLGPTRLPTFVPPTIRMPVPFPRSRVSVRSVPMKLPATDVVVTSPMRRTPVSSLPAITFPAPGDVLPMRSPDDSSTCTPTSFPRTAVSPAFVPMLFPSTRSPVPVTNRCTPAPLLPLMTLPAPGTAPPTVLSSELSIWTPSPLPSAF